jgi:hypothetical protein
MSRIGRDSPGVVRSVAGGVRSSLLRLSAG